MNIGSWLLWGFVATLLLTVFLVATQELRFTRVNIPYVLGTMFTPNRSRAKLVGALVHMVNGYFFSAFYVAAFEAWGAAGWWRGAAIGAVHAVGVLTLGMPLLPGIHPRMASEHAGPTMHRQLEPPGFLALHYGRRTPVSILAAHVLFGVVLGTFYRV
jgi:uncharacterized membrane protein YagU involved in acid resistance